MEKEILDKVLQNVLNLEYGDIIKYQDNTYEYGEDGLICTNNTQGYSCDYIVVGALLEGKCEVTNKINYKQCWKDMKTFLQHNILCRSLEAQILLSNMRVWEEENKEN